ncbi:uncharacterized protein FFB20_15852 [Fusarium fujikuroi]|nr:uncharacterized protein FFE2_02390 [Fusarium fujikuroi]SCN90146.1 uncharacterized protein FFM5_04888 [Fusarium fujikuroi]SCO03152.1 uncharacterized protein FFC1_09221 [Fusarium fujikuroi]SCO20085.1 uncharacterized protein FFB20_15852 [Fusarium fujikuroi]SCO26088.1 uncharacterized protein FFC1_15838 [Fusarium fujikuroi]
MAQGGEEERGGGVLIICWCNEPTLV